LTQVTKKTLFDRLDFIFKRQEWEALADIFWLKQALDLLLAILAEKQSVMLAQNAAKIPALIPLDVLNAALAAAVDQASAHQEAHRVCIVCTSGGP
jgi:hypothetical protein